MIFFCSRSELRLAFWLARLSSWNTAGAWEPSVLLRKRGWRLASAPSKVLFSR